MLLMLLADRALTGLMVDRAAWRLVRLLLLLVFLVLAGLLHDDRVGLLPLLLVLVARPSTILLLLRARRILHVLLLHLVLLLLDLLEASVRGGGVAASGTLHIDWKLHLFIIHVYHVHSIILAYHLAHLIHHLVVILLMMHHVHIL